MFVGLPIVLFVAVATAVPITDLVVITGKTSSCPAGFNRVQQAGNSNGDFNQGAGGQFIYLCVERQMGKGAISRVEIVASDSVDDGCPGSTFGDAQRIQQM